MNFGRLISTLAPLDAKNIKRDALLIWIPLLPLVLALIIRSGIPPLHAALLQQFGFDLAPYFPLIMSGFVLTTSITAGMVIGFLLLDERDEGMLTVLLVTPVPARGYLMYRAGVPVLLGAIMTLISYPMTGLLPLPAADLVVIALLGALLGPMIALALPSYAENKVAGFAFLKFLNTLLIIPMVAFFIKGPVELLFGLIPAYWPLKALWLAIEGEPYGAYVAGGALVNLLFIALLLRRFETVLHR